MKIDVTEADIKAGEQEHCFRCSVALAIARVDPKGRKVSVRRLGIAFFDHDENGHHKIFRVRTPEDALDFVDAFDAGRPVMPFSFDLEIPVSQGG